MWNRPILSELEILTLLGSAFLAGGLLLGCYSTIGYPLLLVAAARLRDRPTGGVREDPEDSSLPRVSVTVPVYNEAHQIDDLLASLSRLQYPRDLLQILIVSDGSTDGTDRRVEAFPDPHVELLRVDEREGKGAAENAAIPHLKGEIIVNTDASIRLAPDALLALVPPFRNPSVGVVSGRDVSVSNHSEDTNRGEAGYVGYEMWVRNLETRVGGLVGASGSLYAIRRTLHETPVPPELSRDFASALIARDHGLTAISCPDAICKVPRTNSIRREYRRKVRTIARGMHTLWSWKHHLSPLRGWSFAWRLWSHKIGRWSMPLAIALITAGLVTLAVTESWAAWLLCGWAVVLLFGAIGWIVALRRGASSLSWLLSLPAYFLMSNVAIVHALLRVVVGGSEGRWEPTRREFLQSGAPPGGVA